MGSSRSLVYGDAGDDAMMNATVLPNMTRNAKRFETIVRTFAKYGLADWIRDWNPDFFKDYFKGVDGKPIAELSREERIRLALTELGTTFIKLGQVLSTHSDVIGSELIAVRKEDPLAPSN